MDDFSKSSSLAPLLPSLVEAWASASGFPDPKDLPAIAKALAQQPKPNPHPRSRRQPRPTEFLRKADPPRGVASNAKRYMI